MNTTYIILLGIFTIATVVIPVWEIMAKNRKPSARGIFIMVAGIAIIVVTILKEDLAKKEAGINEMRAKREKHRSDSIALATLDSAIVSNSRMYTDALARSGWHFDSTTKSIEKSILNPVNAKEIADFGIQHDREAINFNYSAARDSINGIVSFANYGNCPVKVSLNLFLVAERNKELAPVPGIFAVCRDHILSIDGALNKTFNLTGAPVDLQFMHIWMKGHFSTPDNAIHREIDALYSWDFTTNAWGLISDEADRTHVRNFIHAHYLSRQR